MTRHSLKTELTEFAFFVLSPKQQIMPMGAYERTSHEMLVFAGHAERKRATDPQAEEYRSVRC
jgi:hypothetical protein